MVPSCSGAMPQIYRCNMAFRPRNTKKSATTQAPQVEAATVEAPATSTVEGIEAPAAAPAVEAPVTSKPKAVRYAPLSVLANPNAVLTAVVPNPHKPTSLSFKKYGLFEVGLTIAQIEAKFVEHNWPRQKARNQLRWDFAHKHIVIEAPQS
jgi:hypothetical protein